MSLLNLGIIGQNYSQVNRYLRYTGELSAGPLGIQGPSSEDQKKKKQNVILYSGLLLNILFLFHLTRMKIQQNQLKKKHGEELKITENCQSKRTKTIKWRHACNPDSIFFATHEKFCLADDKQVRDNLHLTFIMGIQERLLLARLQNTKGQWGNCWWHTWDNEYMPYC